MTRLWLISLFGRPCGVLRILRASRFARASFSACIFRAAPRR